MDAKRKQLVFLVGSILVAVIFLSSYAAFGNNGTATASTTTVKAQTTYFATGSSNGTITNYSDVATLTLYNSSNTLKTSVINLISHLEANGTVQNYAASNGSYEIVLASISPYDLQQFLYNKTNSTSNSLGIAATSYVELPQNITLYYTNVPVPVYLTNRNYSIYLQRVKPIGSKINVSISALLAKNGSIYQNNFRVSSS
jgi:hypothetical protein